MTDPETKKTATLIIGIDWADRQHVVCLFHEGRPVTTETLDQEPDAIHEWALRIKSRFPEHAVCVAIEQSRGALVQALRQFSEWTIYPINPKQLARYREAIHPSGSKDDPQDAELLAAFLHYHQHKLRPWRPDSPETRRIARLAELRRKLVDHRKSLRQQLIASLKGYFPLALSLFARRLTTDFGLQLLNRWPSLTELRKAHPRTLRKFFADHGIRNTTQQTQWIEAIRKATPLTTDHAVIQPQALLVQCLVRQIAELNRGIDNFEEQLREAVDSHPDAGIFRALPGAGNALVPRLIAAFGSDRDRYDNAAQLQAYSGIAPITRRSGKAVSVARRHACPKFLRQTFHEFADHARKWSPWSTAFYTMKRLAGMKHHAAVRALAFKWQRIMFRLWKNKQIYSENQYLESLRKQNSPLLKFLEEQQTTA